jgi:hypothetical protein
VRTLQDLGCIELVRTAQRRGAIEHYYRAVVRPFFSDRDWKRLPASARQSIADGALQMVWQDVSDSIRGGAFEARSDRHLSRSALQLDELGWTELNEALATLLADAERIETQSAKRLDKAPGTGVSTRLVLMHFESP